MTVWLTGIPAAGKTTLASEVVECLRESGWQATLVDADMGRARLNQDLGFSIRDRDENVRRLGEIALMLAHNGTVAVVAAISPFQGARDLVRRRHDEEAIPYFEVHVATRLDVCIQRDPKGLYASARRGELEALTGFSAPFEPPRAPNLEISTEHLSPTECAWEILARLPLRGPTLRSDPDVINNPTDGRNLSLTRSQMSTRHVLMLAMGLSLSVALVDLVTGPSMRFIGLLAIGPAAVILTGRRMVAAIAGIWAAMLDLICSERDQILGTRSFWIYFVALIVVGVGGTVGASLYARRLPPTDRGLERWVDRERTHEREGWDVSNRLPSRISLPAVNLRRKRSFIADGDR